jgi:UDP-glucose 4-epimerase
MKNILITGGAGFIGSHLVDRYLQDESIESVVVVDNLSTGKLNNLEHLRGNEKLIFLHEDILYINFEELFHDYEIECVHHLAAKINIQEGIADPFAEAKTNIFGTLRMLEAVRSSNILRFVFASSGGMYGQAVITPQAEEHPCSPMWPYGVSKLAAEKYVEQYRNLYSLHTISFRYGIVYGPREWFGRVLTRFIKSILDREEITIFGTGGQLRDFVYVDDIIDAHLLAASDQYYELPNLDYNFNLGSGIGTTIHDLAYLLYDILGEPVQMTFTDPRTHSLRKPQELREYVLESAKANFLLGWTPKVKLEHGLLKMIRWVKKNRDRWE